MPCELSFAQGNVVIYLLLMNEALRWWLGVGRRTVRYRAIFVGPHGQFNLKQSNWAGPASA